MDSSSTSPPEVTTMSATTKVPSSSTFSFVSPFPPNASSSSATTSLPHKAQRRVSLAVPSSPRVFPAWSFRDDMSLGTALNLPEKKGKMRRIAVDDDSDGPLKQTSMLPPTPPTMLSEKKQRKKWSVEETKMLVVGCNKWGVGNWKAILNDPDLKFDNRSPVDLKDRFRTYFPDAYKFHYPNAKTHLSSKVRSALPDGSSIFEKTRSKKRRPFTEEEDRALKAGYDKHGTVWATIVKDPIFQAQSRRSTDLRDRFRNAFPELYQAAGYKPRLSAAKKKQKELGVGADRSPSLEFGPRPAAQDKLRGHPIRAATDDQLTVGESPIGPVRRKRRHTTQGYFRGGTKSVPESTANSEDEESFSDVEEDGGGKDTPLSYSADSTASVSQLQTPENALGDTAMSSSEVEPEIQTLDPLADSLSFVSSDFTDSSQATSWSNIDTPLSSWVPPSTASHASSTLPSSPTPSDYFLPHSPVANGVSTMIGKSAWGTQDWLSPNPRLDTNGPAITNGASSFLAGNTTYSPSPLPSSPFSSTHNQPLSLSHISLNHLTHSQVSSSNHQSLQNHYMQGHSQGLFDKYDLFQSHSFDFDVDFVSEGFDGGTADTDVNSAFSDPAAWGAGTGGGMRGGFTHHSNYAGDLIFGARTHQPTGHMDYGPGFGFGSSAAINGSQTGGGLGLEGVQAPSTMGVLPSQTPTLPGIDEIELAHISLNDRDQPDGMPLDEAVNIPKDNVEMSGITTSGDTDGFAMQPPRVLALDEILGLPLPEDPDEELEDSQDSGLNTSPPQTPLIGFRASGRASVPGLHTPVGNGTTHSHGHGHNRSVSVPPSEHRSPAPQPSFSQSRTPNYQRKYKPLPTPTARQTFQPFQLPHSSIPPTQHPSTTTTPTQTQAPTRPSIQTVNGHSSYAANPADISDLPFLDLHYFSSNSSSLTDATGGLMYPKSNPLGHAQALDLAQAMVKSTHNHSHHKPLCIAPSLVQLVPSTPTTTPIRSHAHHRGQSVTLSVSPQDLILRKGNDNKRKRASWDGGVA